MQSKSLFSWSGGKDSAMAFFYLPKNHFVTSLITTLTKDYDRITHHGVRSNLLDRQSEALRVPVQKIYISKNETLENYALKMKKKLLLNKKLGVTETIFGDIFLEDLKKQREKKLAKIGMKAVFPIWKKDTKKLAHEFIKLGFRAIITSVDTKYLDQSFAGREFDKRFLDDLPSAVDPCGENGEFHTFVYKGPIFNKSINITKGQKTLQKNRFYFCDLLPQ